MDAIKPESKFSELGIDSLDMVELMTELEDETGVEIDLDQKLEFIRNFFQHRYRAESVAPEVIDQVYELITKEDPNETQG